jgi:hypothetical protein
MPNHKIKLSVRETIKELNGKLCLLICVELGNHYFPPRAMHYEVKLNETDALFVLPSADYATLYAYFPLKIPLKGRIFIGYTGDEPGISLPFDFEKRKPELLDRRKLPPQVVEIKERKNLTGK